ncbi:MAG: hypothetical protein M1536_00435 [Firmicutes bacterium]|nr:hypothetical protein [Bacillota bacterium]
MAGIAIHLALTFFAWQSGWKWLAFLPLLIGCTLCYILGVIINPMNGNTIYFSIFATIINLGVIFALMVMIAGKYKVLIRREMTA